MATKRCPRCKEDRMKEWFGDPKAPYAICLSCRVELNGEKKKKTPRLKKSGANCAICERALLQIAELCSQCEAGLNAFQNSARLLGRAASFVSGKLRKPKKKHKIRRFKARNSKLQELIRQQRIDDRERGLRFEHAVNR